MKRQTKSFRCLLGLGLAVMLMLSSTVGAVEIGQPAPDFSLLSTSGDKVSLSQFKGKKHVLIQFYSVDFNPTWTANLSTRTVDHGKFEALNVQVLGIGASNPFSQKTFAASLKLPYPLLSDYPDLAVIREYDVLKYIGESKRPVARGAYFLVDKQGVIRGKWMHPEGMEVFPSDPFIELAQQLEEKS